MFIHLFDSNLVFFILLFVFTHESMKSKCSSSTGIVGRLRCENTKLRELVILVVIAGNIDWNKSKDRRNLRDWEAASPYEELQDWGTVSLDNSSDKPGSRRWALPLHCRYKGCFCSASILRGIWANSSGSSRISVLPLYLHPLQLSVALTAFVGLWCLQSLMSCKMTKIPL